MTTDTHTEWRDSWNCNVEHATFAEPEAAANDGDCPHCGEGLFESPETDGGVTLAYARYGGSYTERHESVDEALKSAYWGEEGGHISTKEILRPDGSAVWTRGRDEDIFTFCEARDYEWVADYV